MARAWRAQRWGRPRLVWRAAEAAASLRAVGATLTGLRGYVGPAGGPLAPAALTR